MTGIPNSFSTSDLASNERFFGDGEDPPPIAVSPPPIASSSSDCGLRVRAICKSPITHFILSILMMITGILLHYALGVNIVYGSCVSDIGFLYFLVTVILWYCRRWREGGEVPPAVNPPSVPAGPLLGISLELDGQKFNPETGELETPPDPRRADNRTDAWGRTMLHIYAERAEPDHIRARLQPNPGGIININARDNLGRTALLTAVSHGNYRCARVLLEHGARTDIADNRGNTPLHAAVNKDSFIMAELLIAHRASKTQRNAADETPYDSATRRALWADFRELLIP
jgi:hypothetical protein